MDRRTHRISILEPAANVLAFYEGRIEGYRFAEEPNWVDEGAISLGIASYAVVAEREALVYDTHVSVERGRFIRRALEERGVEKFTVLLSHWHLDHIAGSEAFRDCEVLATARTAELLEANRAAIEGGTLEGPPAIDPLIQPTRVFSGRERLDLDGTEVELIEVNIHSDDAAVIWLPAQRLLLCGDTMEDTITYVDEPESFDTPIADRPDYLNPAVHRVAQALPRGAGAVRARAARADRRPARGRLGQLLRALRGRPQRKPEGCDGPQR